MAKVSLNPNGGLSVKFEVRFIFAFDALIHSFPIARNLLFQDGGERSAGVFGIDIDASCQHRLLADISSCQIEASFDFYLRARFHHLSEKFTQHQRLGEVFGSDYNAVRMRWRTRS